ncbi:MAG: hypothetical protein ABSG37_03755 [Candidatus Limnocylindrales bacterium]|jgi:hypothetical protein
MFHEIPEQRLVYIKERHADLITEAAAIRSAARPRGRAERRFTGLHLHIGRILIVVGRTLREEDALRPDPIHS